MIGKTIAAVTALTLAGTMVFAAGPGSGRSERHGREGQGDRMARMAEQLQLSDAQVDQLKQMRQADMERNRANRQKAQTLAKQWVELSDKGDTKGAENLQKQLSTMREEAQIRRLAERGSFEAILTDEQKQKLEQLRAERPRHHEGRGGANDAPPAPPEN